MIRVLIADDHAIVRAGFRQFIAEESDMDVVAEAGTGREALDIARKKLCDVILLDISMPGQSGVDTLRAIKEGQPEMPILILSAYPEQQYALTMFKMGANGYLSSEAAIAPKLCQDVITHFAAGRYEDAFRAYHGVMALMTGVSTMPGASVRRVKAAMRLLGLGGTYPRGPYMPIEDGEMTALAKVLRQIGEEHNRPELIPG